MKISYRDISRLFQTLLLWLIVLFAILTTFSERGGEVSVNISYTIPLYLLAIYYLLIKKEVMKIYNWRHLLFFGGSILLFSLLNSIGNKLTSSQVKQILNFAVLPFTGYCFAKYSSEKIRRIFYFGILILLSIGIANGFYMYAINIRYSYETLVYGSRVMSFFGHPIVYCSFLVLIYPLLNYLIAKETARVTLKILFVLGILSTQSRSGWMAFLIVLVINVLTTTNKGILKKKKIYNYLAVFVLFIFVTFIEWNEILKIASYFQNTIINRLSGTMEDVSATQRLGAIRYILSGLTIPGIFFGNGYGSSQNKMLATVISLNDFGAIDNQYVTLLYEQGFFGILYALGLFKIVIKAINNNKEKTSEVRCLAFGILAGLITAFFYELLGWQNVETLFYIMGGMLYFFSRNEE